MAQVNFITESVQTQVLTISQQLNAGIRFLDIRCHHAVTSTQNILAIYHGVFEDQLPDFADTNRLAAPQFLYFDEVLTETTGFLNANPSETVLMRIQSENGDDNPATFERMCLCLWSLYTYVNKKFIEK